MLSRKNRQGKISLKSKTKEFANYNNRNRKKYSPNDKVSIQKKKKRRKKLGGIL